MKSHIALIDHGVGNLRSVEKALAAVGANVSLTRDPDVIVSADKLVLPGVGAFGDCMNGLRESGTLEIVRSLAVERPFLGICVGMQLFAKTGYESQETKGFGWIDAEVRKINNINKKLKLPHMGWNEIELKKDSFLFSNIKNKSHVYFIHSYEFMTKQKDYVIATTNYGNSIIVSVAKENIVGTQFHPEKSQKNGLIILENFLKWKL